MAQAGGHEPDQDLADLRRVELKLGNFPVLAGCAHDRCSGLHPLSWIQSRSYGRNTRGTGDSGTEYTNRLLRSRLTERVRSAATAPPPGPAGGERQGAGVPSPNTLAAFPPSAAATSPAGQPASCSTFCSSRALRCTPGTPGQSVPKIILAASRASGGP